MSVEKRRQPSESGLSEHDLESLKARYFMHAHFIEGLVTGTYRELSQMEVENIVQENFFAFEPIIPLDAEVEDMLRHQVVAHLIRALNLDDKRKLCGRVFLKHGDQNDTLYSDDAEEVAEDSRQQSSDIHLLTLEEKLNLLFNPQTWFGARLKRKGSNSGLTYYGNRSLVGKYDEYFKSVAGFKDFLAKIRKNTGQDKLTVLDIGCGMGKALQDAKEIDPNLETHGITQEQEPAMFEADEYHYIMAERFPTNFRGRFHWINSQVAFRYFNFQHIVLRNVLLSLAAGGFARLGFSFEAKHDSPQIEAYIKKLAPGSKDGYSAMKKLVSVEMAKLDELQRRGRIRYSTNEDFRAMGNQGYLGIEKLTNFDEEDEGLIMADNYGQ